MSTTKEAPATKVIISGRLSYASLFKPTSMDEDEGKKKYQTNLIISKKDKATIKKIEAAIEAAKEEGKAKKWGGKIPKTLELPLRDGDEKENGDEAYAGAFYVNAKSTTKPGLVKKVKGIEGLVAIENEDDLYSGCYVKASINFYPYEFTGKKGIAVGLNNVLFEKDGERLAGRSSAEDDFAEFIEDEDNGGNAGEDDDDLL